MTIYIASDHGGFKMKETVRDYLAAQGLAVVDLGPQALNPADDYPHYAFAVAQAVASDEDALGILLCRSGQGVSIVANKVDGVRAALAWHEEGAEAGRRDDHANVLSLPSDYISEDQAKKIVDKWLATEPGKAERYLRRIREIRAIEENNKNYSN